MDLGLHYWTFSAPGGPQRIPETLAAAAKTAEEAGFAELSVMDHYFQIEQRAHAEEPMLEAYTTLGYVAALTRRIRLAVLVTGVLYRHPGLLAKIVTTLDVLSGGRAQVGIGASWYEKVREQRLIPGWTRFFLSNEVFTANQLPQPGWRRWLPLTRLLPNLRDEICRRWIPGYDQRLDARKRARRTAWLHEHTQGRAAQLKPVEMLSR
jgi:hypothetical protein